MMLATGETQRFGQSQLLGDERFSFAWSAPKALGCCPLIVAVHGSERDHLATRDAFSALAERQGAAVLAPLFPVGAVEVGYGDGYKFLREGDLDYVDLLARMLAQFRAEITATAPKFYLFGFSGGAQFAQRYSLFRGRDLAGLVVAAPGGVTLPDPQVEWWPGLNGAESAVRYQPDLAALQAVPMAVIVGLEDLAGVVPREVGTRNGSAHAGIAGSSRVEKARSLHGAMTALGGSSRLIELPEVGHKLAPNANAASEVLDGWLEIDSTSTKQRDYNA